MSTEPQEPAEISGTPLSSASAPAEIRAQQNPALGTDSLPLETSPAASAAAEPPSETSMAPVSEPAEPDEAMHGEASVDPSDTLEDREDAGAQPIAEHGGYSESQSEQTLESLAAKSARRRLNARDEALALELARKTLLAGRPGVIRVLALAGSLPWVVLVNASAAAWSGLKPTARAQFLKGIGSVPGEGFVRTRMSIIRGLWKADAGAASKAVSMLFKDFVDKTSGLLPMREAIQFGNVFLGRGRPWIASADISSLKEPEQETVRLGIFSACVQTPQAPPVVIYALRSLVDAHLVEKLTPQQLECAERAVAKMSAKWQRTLLDEVPGLPEVFRARISLRGEPLGSSALSDSADRTSTSEGAEEPDAVSTDGADSESNSADAPPHEVGLNETRRERPVYVSKTIPSRQEAKPEDRRNEERRTEEREVREPREARDDRNRRGRDPLPEPRKAAGPFNPAEALRQLDSYIQGLRIELNAAQVRLRQRDDDARRKRPERRSSALPGDPSAEELYRQVRQLELRNAELQAQIEEFRASSEVRGISRGLVDGVVPDDAAAEMRRALSVTLRDDFEDFEALKRDAKDVVVQRYFGSLLQHIFEVLRDEGIVFEGLTPGVETKEQIIESQAALKAVDIVPLVLDEPDDEDLGDLDVLDAKVEDLDETVPHLDADEEDNQPEDSLDDDGSAHADTALSEFGNPVEGVGSEDAPVHFADSESEGLVAERAFSDVSPQEQGELFHPHTTHDAHSDEVHGDIYTTDSAENVLETDSDSASRNSESCETSHTATEPEAATKESVPDTAAGSPSPKRSRTPKSRMPESEA